MSEVKVNKISPRSGTAITVGDSGDTITVASGATLTATTGGGIANDALANNSITINGSAVSLGGSVTIATEARPAFTSITPSTIENTQTTCVIAGVVVLYLCL